MRFFALALAASLAPLALTHPLEKRQNALPTAKSTMDEMVLQLANYLENLERELYTQGYERFTDEQYIAAGFPPGFRENVGVIAQVWQLRIRLVMIDLLTYDVRSMKLSTFKPSPQS